MTRFGFVVGLALIALGAGVGIYGSPYYMLDWGGTLVVSGLGMAACGLVLLMLSAVLRQLHVIAERLEARAGVSPNTLRSDPPLDPPAPAAEPAPEPARAPEPAAAPAAGSLSPGLAGAAAAGAVAAGGGLATAAASILSSVSAGADRPAAAPEPASPAPIRDDLFGKVEEAVRALKDEAGQDAPDITDAAAPEDLASLRAELLADAPPPVIDDTVHDPSSASAPEAPEHPESAPAASDEGVIAAYTVGDSSYTMFADGRIRADTPDGELRFSSMDELKEHMAKRRIAP